MKIKTLKGFKKGLNTNKNKSELTGSQLSKVRGGNNLFEDDEEYQKVHDEVKGK